MITERIGDEYSQAKKKTCKERKCGLSLSRIPNCVVLKGESLPEHFQSGDKQAVCDCFIFDSRDTLTVSIIELKSSSLDATQIQKKFENSRNIVKIIVQKSGCLSSFNLVLILLAKEYSTSQKKKLQSIRIGTGKTSRRVLTMNCGLALKRIKEYEKEILPDGKLC